MYQSIDYHNADPGSQGTFYSSHKIIIVKWSVGFSKDLSTLEVISQVSLKRKQAKKLRMSIKHAHKSLAGINEKHSFISTFISTSIVTQTEKQK